MKNELDNDSIEEDIRRRFKHSLHSQFLAVVLLILSLAISGCGTKNSESKQGRYLNLYVWSAYIPNKTLDDFQKKTGIQVRFDTYESNEAMLEKLQSGVTEYDVVVPSDFMVGTLREQKLLQKLDLNQIPNLKNIHPRFLKLSYDPENENTVPFLWSTTGIGYNKAKISEPVDSWGILWDPKYKDRVLMLDDPRECFGATLKWKGFSFNSTNPTHLLEAKNLLIQQKPLVKMYNSSNFDEVLLGGDVWLAHAWSGNLAKVIEQNHNLDYIIPKEGSALAVENFAIPVNSKHVPEAYSFINFCLDAKVGAEITNLSSYPNTNEAAKAFIHADILNNQVIYPDESMLARCELVKDLGATNLLLDRYWTEIKSR